MYILKVFSAAIVLVFAGGCSQSPLETNFGDSARAMIEEQTLNKSPDPPVMAGDGERLRAVNQNYRNTVSNRRNIQNPTATGMPVQQQSQ